MAKKKHFYKIGEACKELDIQPYVLRYWETEFPFIAPTRSKSGQRVFPAETLEIIRQIKVLLYEEGYTIAGAKKRIEAVLAGDAEAPVASEQPAADEDDDDAPAAPIRTVDPNPQLEARVAGLEAGVRDALAQARALLETLGPR